MNSNQKPPYLVKFFSTENRTAYAFTALSAPKRRAGNWNHNYDIRSGIFLCVSELYSEINGEPRHLLLLVKNSLFYYDKRLFIPIS